MTAFRVNLGYTPLRETSKRDLLDLAEEDKVKKKKKGKKVFRSRAQKVARADLFAFVLKKMVTVVSLVRQNL